jgi:hypothetical protein
MPVLLVDLELYVLSLNHFFDEPIYCSLYAVEVTLYPV